MLSLDKTKSVDELIEFIGDKDCFLSVKADGLTTSLHYINGKLIGAETYIIDFGQDVYGQDIMVELHKFVRPEMKFDSIEALKSQMSADINYTINYAGSHTF